LVFTSFRGVVGLVGCAEAFDGEQPQQAYVLREERGQGVAGELAEDAEELAGVG
jgi:GNAT superfamily N-acetyltransferase